MTKSGYRKGAEDLVKIKCKCGHTKAHHFDTSTGRIKLTKCSQCDCKEFKGKIKDKLKGLLQKD